jgi:hypothetical protein
MSTTCRYPFEVLVESWAARWSTQLVGARAAFFVGLRDDGSVRRVYTSRADRPLTGEQKQLLGQEYRRWMLYLPYEQPGMAYLEWLDLPREAAERWIGRPFAPNDFTDAHGASREEWPTSWRVIVG